MESSMDPLLMEYIIFDVETTGFYPTKGDRIIELAAIKIKKFDVVDTFTTLLNPERLIPEQAQKVNNISDDMVKNSPKAIDILPDFLSFIGGGCLVGHNVKFDLEFLSYELAQIGRKLQDETPALDTLKMAREVIPYLSSYRLGEIARVSGIKVENAHRALVDVHLTFKVLKRLLGAAHDLGIQNFKDLINRFGVQKPKHPIVQPKQDFLF